MRVIYIEDILLDNLLLNALAIWCCAFIVRRHIHKLRPLLAALAGALYALCQVLWGGLWGSLPVRVIAALFMVYIAFNEKQVRPLLKLLICFFAINFLFAGVSFAAAFFGASGMEATGGVLYYKGLPFYVPIGVALLCYIVIRRCWYAVLARLPHDAHTRIRVHIGEQSIEINALTDSGHSLCDPFSKLPVVIVECKKLEGLVPKELIELAQACTPNAQSLEKLPDDIIKTLTWVPYKSVGNLNGMMPCFRPKAMYMSIKGKWVRSRIALVGLCAQELSCDGTYAALIPLLLLQAV